MSEQRKCSLKKHSDINALLFCQECNIYMCNKCNNYHSELHENHNLCEIGKEKINTGLCKEENHKAELLFYCKNHNKLCCAICISKIKGDKYGQHTDCDVCMIEKIADEKINNLDENIKYLEDIALTIDKKMNELKIIVEKIDKNKEELKMKISKIFTKLRNAINDREDELLLDIDNKFNEFIFDDKIIKQSEKLPNQIKEYLIKGKNIKNEWKNNNKKLNIFINDCLNIENNIKIIKIIQQNIANFNSKNVFVKFSPEGGDEINKMINNIKIFGEIFHENKDNIYINNLNSLIINENKIYNKILKSWINEDKVIKAELLYRLTRDGEKVSKFHELCDYKVPTLTIFYTNDGDIGGIYTPLSWDISSEEKSDKETFMFNLNKKEKYKKLQGNTTSIWCIDHFGPWTNFFGFCKTMKIIEHRGEEISNTYENGSNILLNDTKGKKYFDVKEVEVFKISIENIN